MLRRPVSRLFLFFVFLVVLWLCGFLLGFVVVRRAFGFDDARGRAAAAAAAAAACKHNLQAQPQTRNRTHAHTIHTTPQTRRKHATAPKHAVGAAGEVRVLDERDVLGAGEGDADVRAKRLERLI
jgi:hypothetical protein